MRAGDDARAEPPGDVVVVDDTPANLQLLVGILSAHGYRVRPVTSGAAALRTIRARRPDLVLLDIDMPVMNGIEVCKRFRSMDTDAGLPVIFISVISAGLEKVNAFASGAVDYITKPFDADEVLARVGTHIALSRSRGRLTAMVNQLRDLEAMRDTLAHMIAHDMRSPLLTVGLALDALVALVPSGDEPRARAVRHGRACVDGLLDMVRRMLELSQMEQADMPLSRADLDLAALAREVVERIQPRAGGRDMRVVAERPVVLHGDASVLRRVIENLVDNAVKFTGDRGAIEVAVSIEGDGARVVVRDDGPGIAPELHGRLFTRFGHGASDAGPHGFGLGLAFVRLAVEAHGGTVGVRSEPGKGSAFLLILPVRPGPGLELH